jgi:hypothetical protein
MKISASVGRPGFLSALNYNNELSVSESLALSGFGLYISLDCDGDCDSDSERSVAALARLEAIPEIHIPVASGLRVAFLVIVITIKQIFYSRPQIQSGIQRNNPAKIRGGKF